VDGKKVTIPSYLVRPGQIVVVREKSRSITRIQGALEGVLRRGLPSWLELSKDEFKGVYKAVPAREEIAMSINEQLIVELYSK
jgi:small subunit ribosomal protein S4